MFELLYGCGVRVSELAGLDLDDLDRSEGWIRVRGKGRKERQVPLPGKAAEALERYLDERPIVRDERAVFLNHRGSQAHDARHSRHREALCDRPQRRPVASPAQLPPRLRHAPAGRWRRLCAPSRNCWATPAFPPRRSTRRSR